MRRSVEGAAATPERARSSLTWFLESVPEATIAVGAEGRIIEANSRAASLFGYGAGELIGLPVEALLPDSERAAHRRARERYADAPVDRSMGSSLDIVAQRRDGGRFPADIELRPRRLPEGRVTLAVIRDLSSPELSSDRRQRLELERRLQLTHLTGEDLAELLAQLLVSLQAVATEEGPPRDLGSALERALAATVLAQECVEQLLGYTTEESGSG